MARHALAERKVDSVRMVDEQTQPLGARMLAGEDLDARLGRREAVLDVCLKALNLHLVVKKVDPSAHLQLPPGGRRTTEVVKTSVAAQVSINSVTGPSFMRATAIRAP